MSRPGPSMPAVAARRIVFAYALAGSLWILFSDRLMAALPIDNHQMARIALFKGWAYVGLTALLLYVLIRRYLVRQQELDDELQLNRETIERAADEVFWTDETGRIVYANPAACSALGYSTAELRGMTVHDLAPDFPAEVWPNHWQELQQEGSLIFETRQRRKDGTELDIEVCTNHIRHGSRQYTAAFVRDISERKRSQAALLAAEARFRDMLETVQLLAVMLDRDCRVTFCNDYLLALTGWQRDEVIGRDWFELFVPPEERQQVRDVNNANLAERAVPHFENRIVTRQGERRLVVWNNTVLRTPEGEIIGTASIGVDVTEHRQLEAERRQMEQQMLQAQKLEGMATMAGGVAHDFNNILSVIMGNTELALHGLAGGEATELYLQRIHKAAAQAADLARQMLAYTGKGVISLVPLDLNGLVREMRQLLEATTAHRGDLRLPPLLPLPAVEADPLQLRQVIINLVINASEAVGDANGTITIDTGCGEFDHTLLQGCWPLDTQLPPGRYVWLDIRDNGCGMDRETATRIFDPFFSTKFAGRGLGMAAVLGIVRGHGGGISITSSPGMGTNIRLLFPVSGQPDREGVPHRVPRAPLKPGSLVLLVDDEPDVLGCGCEILRELGFQVITADDGEDALQRVRKRGDIELVLLDVTMPRMNGIQALRELRRLAPYLPVVMSSGYSEQEVSRLFNAGEVYGFLQKPYGLAGIQATLEQAGLMPTAGSEI